MKTSTQIALSILSLPFVSFGLFGLWVHLFGHPVHDCVDALGEAAWEVKWHCNEEKLSPCDFQLIKSSNPEFEPWKFSFYSKAHQKTKYVTVYSSSPDDGFRN